MNMFSGVFNALANGMAQAQEEVVRQQNTPFQQVYTCRPVAFINRENLEDGDKILLPASALEVLARKRVKYPMMFQLSNMDGTAKTHCGVMEFSAEEGVAYLPYWMMQNLGLSPEDRIRITNVDLNKGTFVKLRPHRTKFTELPNPRVALEMALRGFSCLTQGDTIRIPFGSDAFLLDIVEVKPGTAISIIETDVNVDFDPPKDYVEPDYKKKEENKDDGVQVIDRAAFFQEISNTPPSKPTSSSFFQQSTPPTSAGPSPSQGASASYFASLGQGYSLKAKKKKKKSKKAKTGDSGSTTPVTPSPSPGPLGRGASPMQVLDLTGDEDGSGSKAAQGKRTKVVDQGKWRFIYEVDDSGKEKLIRREPKLGKSSPFGGKGHSLK